MSADLRSERAGAAGVRFEEAVSLNCLIDILIPFVHADQLRISHFGWPEFRIDSDEKFLHHFDGVAIEPADDPHVIKARMIKRLMMHVLADDTVAELHVLLGVKNVRMPERIDWSRDRMCIRWIEKCNCVVLLEGVDTAIDIVIGEPLPELRKMLAHLTFDAGEIFVIDHGKSPLLFGMDTNPQRRKDRKRFLGHDTLP